MFNWLRLNQTGCNLAYLIILKEKNFDRMNRIISPDSLKYLI